METVQNYKEKAIGLFSRAIIAARRICRVLRRFGMDIADGCG
jgi:hypothetical protein